VTRRRQRLAAALAVSLALGTGRLTAQATIRPRAFSPTTDSTRYPVARLAAGVYAIPGDTLRGGEGRPNAGFLDTKAGLLVLGGLASPAQARAVVRAVRTVSSRPILWLMLYAHHPDMQFGAIVLRHEGARVIAHPDTHVLAIEAGPDQMLADWDQVVGLQEMLGFEYANVPDWPVTGRDTLRLGTERIWFIHPGAAHSAGDLMLWLPGERILFSGDVLMGDGVTMVVDGSSGAMLAALDLIDSLKPKIIVPGHGPIERDPAALTGRTRQYLTDLRGAMGRALDQGLTLRKAIETLPPPDSDRPVSLASRKRRNAVTVYLELERAKMGLDQ
jgi:glyoxylase-like metal-dependent hydrolase (beta-lactamase superfamily II)